MKRTTPITQQGPVVQMTTIFYLVARWLRIVSAESALALLAIANTVEAAEPQISIGGLIHNPSMALKKKFPMCDAYLTVAWIDKQKRIGHTHYVTRMLNDKGELEAEKKSAWALVNLEDSEPSYTLDIYPYVQQKRMSELFNLVRNGKPSKVPAHFAIEYKGKPVVFYDSYAPVFTNHEKTVCIAYPDGQKAWIIEAPNVKGKYSQEQIEELHKQLNFPDDPRARKALENLWVLDFNSDGLDDFLWNGFFSSWGPIAYSSAVALHQVAHNTINEDHVVTSQLGERTCRFKWFDRHPLTTDGKNYFLSHCNLTHLTSSTPKE